METLHLFGTEAQRKQWLEPLMDGEICSGFSMTVAAVATGDASNIQTTDPPRRRTNRHQRAQVVDDRVHLIRAAKS